MISTKKLQYQGVKHRKLEHEKQSHSKKVYDKTQKRFSHGYTGKDRPYQNHKDSEFMYVTLLE
jgi:hypothetical protein